MKFILYFYTFRHLRLVQFVDRLCRLVRKTNIHINKVPATRQVIGQWVRKNIAEPRMLSRGKFLFLNKAGKLDGIDGWNNDAQEKLWLYNLHYFEDLVALNSESRTVWHCELVNNWIHDNPAPQGNGWEPYPLSLRIVNWIKWLLNGQAPEKIWLKSLAQQAHVLSQNLEYHLLGNHLFTNSKALIFVGLYFDGERAEQWLEKGLKILDTELKEQVLSDGGNFELTPMYHNIMLHDLLDLVNIAHTYNHPALSRRLSEWRETASVMLGWMDIMVHPDDEIAFFNDTAIGIAPAPQRLRDYSQNLRIMPIDKGIIHHSDSLTACQLPDSGYMRIDSSECVALLDCAHIGPDYIPGHAHADNLSFELSLYGQRLFVNSGTSCYGLSSERLRQRGTAAHNTVEVDNHNSSEIWSGFRVARRAYPSRPVIEMNNDGMSISCSHDGYRRLKGKVVHHRNWHFKRKLLQVVDQLDGDFSGAKAYFHIHPDVKIEESTDKQCYILTLASGEQAKVQFGGVEASELKASTWHPEFGKSIENYCLVVKFSSGPIITTVEW